MADLRPHPAPTRANPNTLILLDERAAKNERWQIHAGSICPVVGVKSHSVRSLPRVSEVAISRLACYKGTVVTANCRRHGGI
jgi:hypothetical protein